jgi:hypothetical protein
MTFLGLWRTVVPISDGRAFQLLQKLRRASRFTLSRPGPFLKKEPVTRDIALRFWIVPRRTRPFSFSCADNSETLTRKSAGRVGLGYLRKRKNHAVRLDALTPKTNVRNKRQGWFKVTPRTDWWMWMRASSQGRPCVSSGVNEIGCAITTKLALSLELPLSLVGGVPQAAFVRTAFQSSLGDIRGCSWGTSFGLLCIRLFFYSCSTPTGERGDIATGGFALRQAWGRFMLFCRCYIHLEANITGAVEWACCARSILEPAFRASKWHQSCKGTQWQSRLIWAGPSTQ